MKAILAGVLCTMSIYTIAATVSEDVLARLAAVESGTNDAAINFAEGAYGRYQVREPYLADANAALRAALIAERYFPSVITMVFMVRPLRWFLSNLLE